jgi:hypothetical protein
VLRFKSPKQLLISDPSIQLRRKFIDTFFAIEKSLCVKITSSLDDYQLKTTDTTFDEVITLSSRRFIEIILKSYSTKNSI